MGTFKPKEDRPAVEAHFSCVAQLLCVLPLDTNNESLFIGVIGVGMFEAFEGMKEEKKQATWGKQKSIRKSIKKKNFKVDDIGNCYGRVE